MNGKGQRTKGYGKKGYYMKVISPEKRERTNEVRTMGSFYTFLFVFVCEALFFSNSFPRVAELWLLLDHSKVHLTVGAQLTVRSHLTGRDFQRADGSAPPFSLPSPSRPCFIHP